MVKPEGSASAVGCRMMKFSYQRGRVLMITRHY